MELAAETYPHDKKKMRMKKKAKSEVGKLLKSVSSFRPLEELSISNDQLHSFLRSPSKDNFESDGESDSHSHRQNLSRKSSGRGADSLMTGSLGNWSEWSENTSASRLTQHELLLQIEKRAKKNRPPPEYVQPLDELDPSMFSWNRKPVLNKHQSFPAVNIIGCLHPVELILAKADQRMRKREQTMKQKQVKCEERVKEINASLEWKFTRAERYAAILAKKQLQVGWLRILIISRYLKNVQHNYSEKKESLELFRNIARFARIITKAFYRWYRNHIFKKVSFHYKHAFDKCEGALRLHLRIYMKRRAIKRLKQFFNDYKGHHKMNLVVHKYLTAVKRVQRLMRDFLLCKIAKMTAINKLWEKYETQYIRKKLEQKRKRVQEMQLAKKSSDKKFSEIESKSFLEMKQQAQLWSRIDSKVENVVSHLRSTGVIVEENEEDIISKLMIPLDQRAKIIKTIVEGVRKNYFVGQRTLVKKKIEMDATFQEHHAIQLLRGQNDNLNRIINEKFNKKLVNLKYKPFMLFSNLDRKVVWDKMKEAHQLNETFKIKIAQQPDEKKRKT